MAKWPGLAGTAAGTWLGMSMTSGRCCGRQPRAITLDVSQDRPFSLLVCDVCERQQWFRDGEPVDLSEVKVAAATRWNKQKR